MLDARITLPMLTLALAACDARTEDPPGYKLQVTEHPAAVVGERSNLVLDVLRSDGTKATQFEAHHGQAMHLIATTYDLEDFQHVHPRLRGDGSFSVELDFRRPSPYALFAEVTPTASGTTAAGQVLRNTVWPAGARSGFAQLDASAAFDGRMAHRASLPDTRVTIAPLQAPLQANVPVELSIAVDDAQGEPVELQEWMGMPIHAIAVSQDFRQFLHFHGGFASSNAHGHEGHGAHGQHAAGARGPLFVHATFPAAGLYKLWLQVKRAGSVITAPLVLEVSPAPRS